MTWVLFFDGDCGFCSASVRWVARMDQRRRISFAPLQGELAGRLGLSHHADPAGGTMVLLRESDGRVFLRSDAVLELARALGGVWRLCAIGRLIPKFVRDFVYGLIARNRHRIIGNRGFCPLPEAELRNRLRN